jgi:hypothetical protein
MYGPWRSCIPTEFRTCALAWEGPRWEVCNLTKSWKVYTYLAILSSREFAVPVTLYLHKLKIIREFKAGFFKNGRGFVFPAFASTKFHKPTDVFFFMCFVTPRLIFEKKRESTHQKSRSASACLISPTHTWTKEIAPVWCSEFTTKAATIHGDSE